MVLLYMTFHAPYLKFTFASLPWPFCRVTVFLKRSLHEDCNKLVMIRFDLKELYNWFILAAAVPLFPQSLNVSSFFPYSVPALAFVTISVTVWLFRLPCTPNIVLSLHSKCWPVWACAHSHTHTHTHTHTHHDDLGQIWRFLFQA